MRYVDLEPFENYLKKRGLADGRHIPHYLRWVLRFLHSGFDLQRLSARDLLQCYSDQLARDDSVADWQLRQAMRAVELYLNVFLKEEGTGRNDGSPPGTNGPAAKPGCAEEARRS